MEKNKRNKSLRSILQTEKTPDLNFRAISAVCSFIKVLIYMNKTLIGPLRELKNKKKVKTGNPKVVAVSTEPAA